MVIGDDDKSCRIRMQLLLDTMTADLLMKGRQINQIILRLVQVLNNCTFR